MIDIEMQRYIEQAIHKRMFRYGNALYFQSFTKTIVIVLYTLNKKRNKNKNFSFQIMPCLEENEIQEQDDNRLVEITFLNDFFSILQIDLDYTSNMLLQGEKPQINGKYLNDNGYSWLKFLGIQSWCSGNNEIYYLPNNMNISEELNSAISFLSIVDRYMYSSIIINEEKNFNLMNQERQKGREEGLKKD